MTNFILEKMISGKNLQEAIQEVEHFLENLSDLQLRGFFERKIIENAGFFQTNKPENYLTPEELNNNSGIGLYLGEKKQITKNQTIIIQEIQNFRMKLLRKHIGSIGEKCFLGDDISFGRIENVFIGNNTCIANCYMHPGPTIGKIEIGDFSFVGGYIAGGGHDTKKNVKIWSQDIYEAPVKIGDDVMLNRGCVILPGITVNNGAIVAAGAVVTKDVPENAIVGGNPAKVIKYRE